MKDGDQFERFIMKDGDQFEYDHVQQRELKLFT
jgi:hypothetical protein